MNKYLLIEMALFVSAFLLLLYENYIREGEYESISFSTLLFIAVVPPFNMAIVFIELLVLALLMFMPVVYVVNLIRGKF